MDSKLHSKLSRQRTTVSRRVGGAFKVGHDLEGKNLRLTKDRRIVQKTGVPDKYFGETSKGWRVYYWTPLRSQYAPRRAK
jgi:hypothetical protein